MVCPKAGHPTMHDTVGGYHVGRHWNAAGLEFIISSLLLRMCHRNSASSVPAAGSQVQVLLITVR